MVVSWAADGALQVDAEEYFDDQREVEYFCFNQQYHRAPKQVPHL
jgi:hypothetical protein